jgi:urease accessory protein
VLFPGLRGSGIEEAVLVNTAGGIAGGDRLECAVLALPDSSVAVTSQAAERIYRALSEPARITTELKVEATAKLAWLPQETIVFNGAALHRETRVEISSGAQLLALEWLVLGRAAHAEEVVRGYINDRWHVSQDGRLIWADCFRVTDPMFARLRSPALLGDCKTIATLVYFGPELVERLRLIRELAVTPQCLCAATLVAGLLIVRLAARVCSDLREGLRRVLESFSRMPEPHPFRIPRMWSC